MGNGQIGGDGSVKWKFRGDSAKGDVSSVQTKRRVEQSAVDDTNANEKFIVTIKSPKQKKALKILKQKVEKWAERPTDALTITLPIEDRTEDQIVIKWNSKRSRRKK